MLNAHGETDIGKHRKINEDSIFVADGLFIVCDGMGGHQAGEVASALAVDTIARFVQRSEEDRELTWPFGFNPRQSFDANRLRTAVKLANRAVFKHASSSEAYTGMGTTVAAALVSSGEPRMTYTHVGDSRVYLVRPGAILPLTRDDSWANLARSARPDEDPAATDPTMKNILTKALGARSDVEFEVADQTLEAGDVVLLCSDGLTNMLPDDRILALVTAQLTDLPEACRALVAAANAAGGRDNISVILARHRA
ncbi:MAG TPA: protein phosphatase 2C domain-containing protein [Methylomirabilota bacterium]|jgi:protein phosphatase|nr:protein phosphatase 2C domain-containing protein [Methylomirabilota bacterium]